MVIAMTASAIKTPRSGGQESGGVHHSHFRQTLPGAPIEQPEAHPGSYAGQRSQRHVSNERRPDGHHAPQAARRELRWTF